MVSFFFNRPNGPRGPAIALAFFLPFLIFRFHFRFFLNCSHFENIEFGATSQGKNKNLKPRNFVAIMLFPVGGLGSWGVSAGYIWTSSNGFHWFSIDVLRKIVKIHCFLIYSERNILKIHGGSLISNRFLKQHGENRLLLIDFESILS